MLSLGGFGIYFYLLLDQILETARPNFRPGWVTAARASFYVRLQYDLGGFCDFFW